ncbi:hypothetical protein [Segetibacter sp.]|jgi:hypothetical protein|uniref:hypothetical protein n=1 Tax=Segetibacter sp. TaxID=2231182 RepID=UPI00262D0CC8|nr:hypothetical protein [Segetibacter sp.]MCW3080946.1 hypothetical protein [Segetibacter sp.]
MKKLVLFFLIPAFASCGNNNSAENPTADTVKIDTSFSGHVLTDTSTGTIMNADTTGMGEAR